MEVKIDNDGMWFDAKYECHVFGIDEVTHWMPLPPNPKDAELS
jgi:hypothetical protein